MEKVLSEFQESFNYREEFQMTNDELFVPGEELINFKIPSVTDTNKVKIMESTIKVLSNIPTKYSIEEIKEMLEYFFHPCVVNALTSKRR